MADESRSYRASDEVETIKFREQMHGKMQVLELGNQLIHDCIDRINVSLTEFKAGMGKRLEEVDGRTDTHNDRLTRLEVSLAIMVKVTWIIVVCSITTVIGAAWKLLLK